MFLHTAWIVFSLSSSSLDADGVRTMVVAGGGAAGLGHVGLVEGAQAGKVAGRVERVQRRVDRGRQQRVLESSATGHKVESLKSLLQQIWCIRHQRDLMSWSVSAV